MDFSVEALLIPQTPLSSRTLTPRQRDVRDRARAFADQHILPVAARHDVEATYPKDVIERAREEGLLNTVIPAAFGGPGFTAVEDVLLAEEFGYGCTGIWTTMAIPNLAEVPIAVGGSPEQRREIFGAVVDGATPAFALTEPTGGSDVAGLLTLAERRGDHYVISGAKRYISTAREASFFVLFAKTDPDAGHRGISAFVVPADSAGIEIVQSFDKVGHRAYDTSDLRLDGVVVPASALLGGEGQGFRLAMAAFDRNRPAVAAAATGLARRALDESVDYALGRTAFGTPIFGFQAISHKLADIATAVQASRLLCLAAADELDAGMANTQAAAYAKLFATDTAMRAAVDAVQVFGAAGIMTSNPVEKLLRDAKVLQVYEGTNEIQRNIIARELARSHDHAARVALMNAT